MAAGDRQPIAGWTCLRLGRLLFLWKRPGYETILLVPLASKAEQLEQIYPSAEIGVGWEVRSDSDSDSDSTVVAISVRADVASARVLLLQEP